MIGPNTFMKASEWIKKQEEFVNELVNELKSTGNGIAINNVVCPKCSADLTEWYLRKELATAFGKFMLNHNILPEPEE